MVHGEERDSKERGICTDGADKRRGERMNSCENGFLDGGTEW